MKAAITQDEVKKIASLANLGLNEEELKRFPSQFNKTLEVVDQLNEIETKNVSETAQVTGLTNVWREDEIDKDRTLSQLEALDQAKESHEGYFVVPRIIE